MNNDAHACQFLNHSDRTTPHIKFHSINILKRVDGRVLGALGENGLAAVLRAEIGSWLTGLRAVRLLRLSIHVALRNVIVKLHVDAEPADDVVDEFVTMQCVASSAMWNGRMS